MSDEQSERVHELKNKLSKEVHELIDKTLLVEDVEVNFAVREQLGEQFRFWKR